jgi:hypothetical protein
MIQLNKNQLNWKKEYLGKTFFDTLVKWINIMTYMGFYLHYGRRQDVSKQYHLSNPTDFQKKRFFLFLLNLYF